MIAALFVQAGGCYAGGEVVVLLDRAELACLRDACTDALKWVRK